MTHHKGFVGVAALVVIGLLVLGGVGYFIFKPEISHAPIQPEENRDAQSSTDTHASVSVEPSITWTLKDAGERPEYPTVPFTRVILTVNGVSHEIGTYEGTCGEIGSRKTMHGELLAGELSAVQCFWGGGGHEIGVFAIEDGGMEVMVGEIGEPSAYDPGFRGDFEIRTDIKL